MSPEAQRLAIAEACPRIAYFDHRGLPRWIDRGSYDESGCFVDDLFDPLNDLNAMHEAEKGMNTSQQTAYFMALEMIAAKRMMSLRHQQYYGMVTASAAQRAEAFLKTIGKWEDDK